MRDPLFKDLLVGCHAGYVLFPGSSKVLYADLSSLPLFTQRLPGSVEHEIVGSGRVEAAKIKPGYKFLVDPAAALLSVEDEVNQQRVRSTPGKTCQPGPGRAADSQPGNDVAGRVNQLVEPCSREGIPGVPGGLVAGRVALQGGFSSVGSRNAPACGIFHVDIHVDMEARPGALEGPG